MSSSSITTSLGLGLSSCAGGCSAVSRPTTAIAGISGPSFRFVDMTSCCTGAMAKNKSLSPCSMIVVINGYRIPRSGSGKMIAFGSMNSSFTSASAASSSSSTTATIIKEDEEEEQKEVLQKKIGSRVRVKVPLQVYHVPRVPEVDLTGVEGHLKQYVAEWKGKRISANLPYKIEFLIDVEGRGPVKFFAHLKEDEFEYLDKD